MNLILLECRISFREVFLNVYFKYFTETTINDFITQMFRPRVIPVLLLKNEGLVKSVKFKNHRYIGDPINAVKIFNDLKADELVFLDILASQENRVISESFVTKVGEETNMPFAVGGGIHTLDQIRRIINAGAEKVVINREAILLSLIHI